MKSIGKRIREERIKAGMTQKQLAEAAGIAMITLSQYEREMRQPRIAQLQAISNALNVTTDELMGIKPLPPKNILIYEGTGFEQNVTVGGGALETDTFDTFLTDLGFHTFIDAARLKNPKGKYGDVWIIWNKRENLYYSTTTDELNKLMDSVLSYTKYQIHELLLKSNQIPLDEIPQEWPKYHLKEKPERERDS